MALARAAKVKVVQADAAEWIDKRLTERRSGAASVVFHSIVWQYLPAETKSKIEASIDLSGRAAGAEAPIVWLRLEPNGPGDPYLKLTLWPGGQTRTLARAHFHGASVDWLGE